MAVELEMYIQIYNTIYQYVFQHSLLQLGEFDHQMNDGWGLTTDGKILFGSDGSSTLYQFDPQTMEGTILPSSKLFQINL